MAEPSDGSWSCSHKPSSYSQHSGHSSYSIVIKLSNSCTTKYILKIPLPFRTMYTNPASWVTLYHLKSALDIIGMYDLYGKGFAAYNYFF